MIFDRSIRGLSFPFVAWLDTEEGEKEGEEEEEGSFASRRMITIDSILILFFLRDSRFISVPVLRSLVTSRCIL